MCLSRVADLQPNEVKCKAWHVLEKKLFGLNWTHVEDSTYQLIRTCLLPGVVHVHGTSNSDLTQSNLCRCFDALHF